MLTDCLPKLSVDFNVDSWGKPRFLTKGASGSWNHETNPLVAPWILVQNEKKTTYFQQKNNSMLQ